MTRRLTHAAALALAPASLRALNPPPRAPVAPPAPAKRPGRGSARPTTPEALPGALDAAAGVVVVELPGLRLASEANARGHSLGAKSSRAKALRAAVLRGLAGRTLPPLPVRVCVTRVSPRRVDTDNLASACKAPRDAAAEALGIDDGPAETRATWRESQVAGPYGARVTIVHVDGRASVVAGERADVVAMRLTPGEASALCAALARGSAVVTVGGVELRLTTDGGRR